MCSQLGSWLPANRGPWGGWLPTAPSSPPRDMGGHSWQQHKLCWSHEGEVCSWGEPWCGQPHAAFLPLRGLLPTGWWRMEVPYRVLFCRLSQRETHQESRIPAKAGASRSTAGGTRGCSALARTRLSVVSRNARAGERKLHISSMYIIFRRGRGESLGPLITFILLPLDCWLCM